MNEQLKPDREQIDDDPDKRINKKIPIITISYLKNSGLVRVQGVQDLRN